MLNSSIQLRPAIIADLATNDRAHRFYERLGFKFVEQKRLGEDESDCFVFELRGEDWGKRANSNQP